MQAVEKLRINLHERLRFAVGNVRQMLIMLWFDGPRWLYQPGAYRLYWLPDRPAPFTVSLMPPPVTAVLSIGCPAKVVWVYTPEMPVAAVVRSDQRIANWQIIGDRARVPRSLLGERVGRTHRAVARSAAPMERPHDAVEDRVIGQEVEEANVDWRMLVANIQTDRNFVDAIFAGADKIAGHGGTCARGFIVGPVERWNAPGPTFLTYRYAASTVSEAPSLGLQGQQFLGFAARHDPPSLAMMEQRPASPCPRLQSIELAIRKPFAQRPTIPAANGEMHPIKRDGDFGRTQLTASSL